MENQNLQRWHKVVAEADVELLRELLHEDVEFHSPTVWTPKNGRDVTQFILMNVLEIFQNFRYHRELVVGDDMALEFSAEVFDKRIKGIDLIKWNDQGQIIHFEVMVRPLNGLQALAEEMSRRVQAAGFA